MKTLKLSRSDLAVTQFCFGCWGIVSDAHWGDRSEATARSTISAALSAGINFFDTAPLYGDGASEELLGKCLAESGTRQRVVVATKIRPDRMRRDEVIEECEASLRRLQTDYIDLYQTHWTNPEVPLEEAWAAMHELQKQGKVREIACCNAGIQDLTSLAKTKMPVTNQLPYNLLWRAIEHTILPACEAEQIGVLVYSPLMHGMLADKYQTAAEVPDGRARSRHFNSERSLTRHGEPGCEVETFSTLDKIRKIALDADLTMSELAIAWLLQHTVVTSVIVGAGSPEQLQSNISAFELNLPAEVFGKLTEVTEDLKDALGENPDMWDGGDRGRFS